MAYQIIDKTVNSTQDLLLTNRNNGSELKLKERKKSITKLDKGGEEDFHPKKKRKGQIRSQCLSI